MEFNNKNVTVEEIDKFQNPFCVYMCKARTKTSCPVIEGKKCNPEGEPSSLLKEQEK